MGIDATEAGTPIETGNVGRAGDGRHSPPLVHLSYEGDSCRQKAAPPSSRRIYPGLRAAPGPRGVRHADCVLERLRTAAPPIRRDFARAHTRDHRLKECP